MATSRIPQDDVPLLPEHGSDESDEGWSEPVRSADDEDRLRQDRPPHHDGRSAR